MSFYSGLNIDNHHCSDQNQIHNKVENATEAKALVFNTEQWQKKQIWGKKQIKSGNECSKIWLSYHSE